MKVGVFILLTAAIVTGYVFSEDGTESFKTDLDYAQVVHVRAVQNAQGLWQFDVTVRHNDEGWNHYADAWQIVNPKNGTVISERILAHPHVEEQPFTRSKGGIALPAGLKEVLVRAKCQLHGFGGQEILVPLKPGKSSLFEVLMNKAAKEGLHKAY